MRNLFRLLIFFAVVPVFAHHGTGISYDNSTLITSKALVTAFEFTNPHVRIFFDTTDDKGNIRHWSGEMANPAQYIRAGWGKKRSLDALKPGTPITISYWLSKAEEHLPADIGAALVVRIRDAKDERVLLDRR
jgi:Family of unknown function (DUF6152)